MKIKINELETITKKLFQHLRNQKILEFDIEEDFYWNIDKNERYNPYKKPVAIRTFTFYKYIILVKLIKDNDRQCFINTNYLLSIS